MRVAIKFAYHGKPYHGYARQPNLNTVEGTIISNLIQKGYIKSPKESLFKSASRTDKGVSSLGNVVAFNSRKNIENLLDECNNSSEHIILYGIKPVDETFYPRYAKHRIYDYYLIKKTIQINTLKEITPLFIGTYNFSNFARVEPQKNPIRTINSIQIHDTKAYYIISFQAQTYLWQQIRRIIAAIQLVEKGKITAENIKKALQHPEHTLDFGVAESAPLILRDIIYDFSFTYDSYWLEKKEKFKHRILQQIKCPFF